MHDPDRPRFFYHGSAFALGGQITRPFSDVLEVQAATTLPSVGGYGSVRAEKFRYRELISFESAYSQVTGSTRDGVHEAVIQVAVEGLNIMDIVTADRVVARLTSSHGSVAQSGDAASLLPVGSYFVNLRIAGVPVEPRHQNILLRRGKLSELEHEYRTVDSPFVDRDGQPFRFPERRGAAETALAEGGRLRRVDDCHLVTSIFQGLEVEDAPFEIRPGCGLRIDGFGEIILGQYVITRESRRLSMIVVHLGCPYGGTVTAGEGGGNG